MPESVLPFFILKFVERNGCIAVDRTVQLYCFAIDTARYNVASESRRNALGDLKSGHSLFVLTDRAIRKCDFYHNNDTIICNYM